MLTKNKRLYSASLDLIRKYLDLGFVPVIYGDVVLDLDESIKIAVLSGDQIVKYLAENLRPERVIMASDVDGIYNKNPKINPDAELLKVVTSNEQIELIKNNQTVDVTGGMSGKLTELLELANLGVESEIINANKFNIIKNALNGEKVTGTLIKKNI
jgi:isopentenyl phosphate kinase